MRVRRKPKETTDTGQVVKKGSEAGVQDSGFSTETSSKETHSASSTAAPGSSAATSHPDQDETEDELWNLLDVIHRKG